MLQSASYFSKLEDARDGVPNGTCVGPIFFLAYINNLHLALKNNKVPTYVKYTSICFSLGSVADINRAINANL